MLAIRKKHADISRAYMLILADMMMSARAAEMRNATARYNRHHGHDQYDKSIFASLADDAIDVLGMPSIMMPMYGR